MMRLTPEQKAGVRAHALFALAAYQSDHDLPDPGTITFPAGERQVYVYAHAGDWADHLPEILDHRCDPPTKTGWVRVEAEGRLPNSGVEVRIIWFERSLHPSDA